MTPASQSSLISFRSFLATKEKIAINHSHMANFNKALFKVVCQKHEEILTVSIFSCDD